MIAAVGAGVTKYQPGDRVIVFHHIPCGKCFYCGKKLYAQCPVYKKVGVTAGYEPAGGGFSQYVRVMDWIVERGIEKIPDGVSFDAASFVEPVNTCLKGMKQLDPQPGDVVAILGQGPVGLIFTMMAAREGLRIVATDTFESRRKLARKFGAHETFDPRDAAFETAIKEMTDGRGADLVIIAASAKGIVNKRWRFRVRARAFCCLRRLHIRSASKFRAPIFVWESACCAAPIARLSMCRRNPRTWFFRVRYLWRN